MLSIKRVRMCMRFIMCFILIFLVFNNKNVFGEKKIKIGIVQIDSHAALEDAREGFFRGLQNEGIYENIEFIMRNPKGDMKQLREAVEEFSKIDVDMIYAISTPAAKAAVKYAKEIPVVISAVTDPVKAGLVESLDIPNSNVSGTSDMAPVEKQLGMLEKLDIRIKSIGVVYNTEESNSAIEIQRLKVAADKKGITVKAIGIKSKDELEEALDKIIDKVQAIYTPTDNLIATHIDVIVRKSMVGRIPILASEPKHVEAGALITFGIDYFDLGIKSGEIAAQIINGKDISKIPIRNGEKYLLIINKKTAEKLNIHIGDEILKKSIVIEN